MTPGGNRRNNNTSSFSFYGKDKCGLKNEVISKFAVANSITSKYKQYYYTMTVKLNTGTHRKDGIVPEGTYSLIISKYQQLVEDVCGSSNSFFDTYFELDSKCQLHTHSFFNRIGLPMDLYELEEEFRIWKKEHYPKYTVFTTLLKTADTSDKWKSYIGKWPTDLAKNIYATLRKYKLNRKNKLHEAITVRYKPKRFLLNYTKVPVHSTQKYLPDFLD